MIQAFYYQAGSSPLQIFPHYSNRHKSLIIKALPLLDQCIIKMQYMDIRICSFLKLP